MMGFVMSGKKVVVCPRSPLLLSLAIGEISIKNKIICNTKLVNVWILADKACHLTVFQILPLFNIS